MRRRRPDIFGIIQKAAAVVTACSILIGVPYAALDYFATKKEVTRLRCEMDANIEYITSKQSAAEYAKIIQDNAIERKTLESKKMLTDKQKSDLVGLEIYVKGIEDSLKKAQDHVEEASRRLDKQECSK